MNPGKNLIFAMLPQGAIRTKIFHYIFKDLLITENANMFKIYKNIEIQNIKV